MLIMFFNKLFGSKEVRIPLGPTKGSISTLSQLDESDRADSACRIDPDQIV